MPIDLPKLAGVTQAPIFYTRKIEDCEETSEPWTGYKDTMELADNMCKSSAKDDKVDSQVKVD